MNSETVIDTHVHFWDLERLRYGWLTDAIVEDHIAGDYSPICNRDYLPGTYEQEWPSQTTLKCVHVDCALDEPDPVEETRWIEQQAATHKWILGIVARGDLTSDAIEEELNSHMRASPRFRGIRMFCGAEAWASSSLRRGLRCLAGRGLSFDLDADPSTIPFIIPALKKCDDLTVLVGHAGFPKSRDRDYFLTWRKQMRRLAELPNVACKISGLGMGDHKWTVESIRPWVLECLNIFGVDRCLFGSNWPVDSLYSSFSTLYQAYKTVLGGVSARDAHLFFYENACRYYRLD